MRRCGAFTLIEALVAASLFAVTLAGSYAFFSAASRAGATIDRYSGQMQALASIQARYEADMRAVIVPEFLDLRNTGLELTDGGRGLSLSRMERVRDLELARDSDEASRRVDWKVEGAAGGPMVLVREVQGGETTRWPELAIESIRFAIEPVDFEVFVSFELLATVPPPPGSPNAVRKLPLRLVHRLRPPGRLTGPGRDYPTDLLGALPPDTGGPTS